MSEFQKSFRTVHMANKDEESPVIRHQSGLQKRVQDYQEWDDSSYQRDWPKSTNRILAWGIGCGLIGGLRGIWTSKPKLTMVGTHGLWGLYVSAGYYVSRELIYGVEIERYKREALALGLSENDAKNYPYHWDFTCGGVSGLMAAMFTRKGPLFLVGPVLFGVAAMSIRWISNAFPRYVLPTLFKKDASELQQESDRVLMSETKSEAAERAARIKEAEDLLKEENAALRPQWFPIQKLTPRQVEIRKGEQERLKSLEQEVAELRKRVALKRQLKRLEEERYGHLKNDQPESLQSSESSSSESSL